MIESESIATATTPKKGRRAVKVVEPGVVAKSTAKPTKQKLKAELEYEEESIEAPDGSLKIKINRVKAEAVLEEGKAPQSKKASAKRKAKIAEDDEDEVSEEKKVKKKRKTKEEKEAETMPLAARTAIKGLKKALYIGAHVSGAGGIFS
jgi:AP endonuclease-1